MNRFVLAALAFSLSASLAVPAGAATVVLPRPGQVGFSFQGQGGTLAKAGEFGQDFGAGGGLAVRLRYRMRFERGIGLSFERQTFGVRNELAGVDTAAKTLTFTTASGEVYQMFGTRTNTVKMLSAGIGLLQSTQKLNDGESKISGTGVGDGLMLSAGAGVERFVWQSWAIDLSTRYFAIFHNGKVNHDVQVSAGLIFYAGY